MARAPRKVLPARVAAPGASVRAGRATQCTRGDLLNLPRLSFLRKAFEARLPKQVAQSLTEAHRKSTRSQYEPCWKIFQQWLQQQPAGRVSKGLILAFLHFLSHTKSFNPKTILVYRNALRLPLLHDFF